MYQVVFVLRLESVVCFFDGFLSVMLSLVFFFTVVRFSLGIPLRRKSVLEGKWKILLNHGKLRLW